MYRREFLVGAAGAVSVVARPAEGRIRIAFFGGSHSHALEKVKVVKGSPDYELIGVWEDDPAVLAKYTAMGVPAIKPDAVLKDDSVRVIAVESAVKDHAAHALMALEAGKHVHVEKPPADSMDAFQKLVSVARRRNLLLQSGYMWRYNPAINKALEAARSGWLGEVYMVRAVMNTSIAPERRPEWGMFKGGQMFEMGSHLIDVVVRLLGLPEKVTSVLKHHGRFDDPLKDNTVAIFEYPKALAIIQSATLQPNAGPHRGFEFQGTNGTAVVRPVEPPALHIDLSRASGPYQPKMQKVDVPAYTRYVDDMAELAAAVRGDKPLSVSLDQEVLIQETLMRACES